MAQILLLNPTAPRKGKKMATKKRRSAAQKRATAKLIANNRARRGRSSGARKSSPKRRAVVTVMANPVRRRVKRRSNPVVSRSVSRRRRRNPISLGGSGGSSVIAMLKGAAIGGAGAVAMDVVIGQINKFLPASLLGERGKIDQGDAVKFALTVALGKLLNKPTKGLSMQAAKASLMVQAYGMISSIVPDAMTLGYASPGRIVNGTARVGPNVRQSVQRFSPGAPQLLNGVGRYVSGPSPLLNGSTSSMQNRLAREGFNFR